MDAPMEGGTLAEFATADELLTAVHALRRAGYTKMDAFTPYPVTGLEDALAIRRSALPWLVFVVAAGGAVFAFGLQWWTNGVDYPLNVGGRPLFSAPAWVPITFETIILTAALTAFFGFFWKIGLPRLWHPVFEISGWERAAIDRFWVGIDRSDPQFDAERCAAELAEMAPLRIVRLEDE